MKRYLLILSLFVISFNTTLAAYYSVEPCENVTQENFLIQLKSKGIKVIQVFREVNAVLVDVSSEEELSDVCFYAEVRIFEQKLCFNTRTLLVKLKTQNSPLVEELSLEPHAVIPALYYLRSSVHNGAELTALKTKIEEKIGVGSVSYNQVFTLSPTVNDPLYARQWAIENTGSAIQYNGTPGADMSVDSAWTITTGDPSIKIAVLDSGVDTLHEDLDIQLLPGFDSFADSANNTMGHPTPNYSSDGHGTSCAGIIGAIGDNGLGTAGIAYTSKMIPIRIFYYVDYGAGIGVQATTNTDALISGTGYAWRIADADILSTSAGLNNLFIQVLQVDTVLVNAEINEAYTDARNGKGIAMFFSSGNDNISDVLWPADLASTIAVGATSMCDERKNPSDCSGENWGGSFGEKLDVSAPGVKIATSDMTGANGFSATNYTYTFNGTSAACPNAAAVGALILSVNPNLEAEDVRAIINMTADRVAGYMYDSISPNGTWNTQMGHGRVNAFEAVKLAQTYVAGVELNETNQQQVLVFPNPTKGEVHVNTTIKGEWTYEVVNLQGKLILSGKSAVSAVSFNLTQPGGIYFVRVIAEGYDRVTKLVVE